MENRHGDRIVETLPGINEKVFTSRNLFPIMFPIKRLDGQDYLHSRQNVSTWQEAVREKGAFGLYAHELWTSLKKFAKDFCEIVFQGH